MTQPLIPHPLPHMSAGPSYMPRPVLYTSPSPTVYNYINPRTGEQVVSLLPPNHPEMICLQAGEHIPHTQYGLLGKCSFHLNFHAQSTSVLIKYITHLKVSSLRYSGSLWASVSVCLIRTCAALDAGRSSKTGCVAKIHHTMRI